MKKATLKTIESNDAVSLYSICFDGSKVVIEKNYIIGLEGATFEL